MCVQFHKGILNQILCPVYIINKAIYKIQQSVFITMNNFIKCPDVPILEFFYQYFISYFKIRHIFLYIYLQQRVQLMQNHIMK